MKIARREKIIKEVIGERIYARECDFCKNRVDPNNYFVVETWHSDWGNDSVDSRESYDACSPGCVLKFAEEYLRKAFEKPVNSKEIRVEHVRSLRSGSREGGYWNADYETYEEDVNE